MLPIWFPASPMRAMEERSLYYMCCSVNFQLHEKLNLVSIKSTEFNLYHIHSTGIQQNYTLSLLGCWFLKTETLWLGVALVQNWDDSVHTWLTVKVAEKNTGLNTEILRPIWSCCLSSHRGVKINQVLLPTSQQWAWNICGWSLRISI